MSEEQDIRWKQRFENYRKALATLRRTAAKPELSEAERGGLIQFFEMSFELAWKTMKDYLEANGFPEIRSPRDVLKLAFQAGLIEQGRAWMQALEDRNLTTHTYHDETALKVEQDIRTLYLPLLTNLEDVLDRKLA